VFTWNIELFKAFFATQHAKDVILHIKLLNKV